MKEDFISFADEEISQKALLYELASPRGVTITQEGELVTSQEFPFLDLPTIRAATDDFSDSNRLGQGGFGTVYKVSKSYDLLFLQSLL